jgi:GMP synthase (glutamine-hydrolysing)
MPDKQQECVVLSHVPFEDLGSLQPELDRRGFSILTIDAPTASFPLPEIDRCDLLVVMGGPISVYETGDYPFLVGEIASIRQRLCAKKPTLGICLGAQLMAAALGARVYSGSRGAEIGWFPIQPTVGGPTPEWLEPLFAQGIPVFHWHGDTFDIPAGAQALAKSNLYENQAFAVGDYALAFQFHAEVTALGLERWYVGHTCELNKRGIKVQELRSAALAHAPMLERAAAEFWQRWLDYIL